MLKLQESTGVLNKIQDRVPKEEEEKEKLNARPHIELKLH